jgi:N-hydroxyarylamine O-acetyltransferase
MRAVLPRDLVERVLARLGVPRWPQTTPAQLAALYAAWCENVPFDNVRKLLHVAGGSAGGLPGDDAREFFESWLAFGTGGTCWAGNGALQALLAALGFQATRGVGTMLVAPDVPPNHGTVLVTCEGARYLVDASMLHGVPLRLDARLPTQVEHPAWGVSCEHRERRWHVRWRPLHMPNDLECSVYRLDTLDATPEAFSELHERTRAWSPFNYELYLRRNRGQAVIGIARGKRVEFDAAGRFHARALDARERLRYLVEELGIAEALAARLPADRPTPPPPGSRTARRGAAEARAAFPA